MENKSGFIVLYKPRGPSSHAMVDKLRRITGVRRIGHAGTLDPFASGVLIMAIGRESTKRLNVFLKMEKEYLATVLLGTETDTYDREGKITHETSLSHYPLSVKEIKETLSTFIGKQQQLPPMYSAKKVQGKKMYQLARKGIAIERKPAEINIMAIDIESCAFPLLKIRIRCSSGTYIRTLAHDIGEKLGVGACLEGLERTAVGCYTKDMARDIASLCENDWPEALFDI